MHLFSLHFKINTLLILVIIALLIGGNGKLFAILLCGSFFAMYIYFAIYIYLLNNKNIINFTFLSTKKIRSALNLLPKEYCANIIPVYIFPNHFVYKLYLLFLPSSICFTSSLAETTGGFFSYNNFGPKFIVIFNVSYNFTTIHALFHEFRHVHQYKLGYMKKGFSSHIDLSNAQKDDGAIIYNSQLIEKDANRFAASFIKKHKHFFMKHFNFKYTTFNISDKYMHFYNIYGYKDTSLFYFLNKINIWLYNRKILKLK